MAQISAHQAVNITSPGILNQFGDLALLGAATCHPWESTEARERALDPPEDLVSKAEKEQLLRRRVQGENAGQVDGVDLLRMRAGARRCGLVTS